MADRIAIIPARAGSKGVPGKNKRVVAGKPLIAYSWEAAKAARSIDRIIVSTDDEDIANLAEISGVEVVRRPAKIAADDSPVIDAVLHALKESGIAAPRVVVLLQPTSPLRSGADIDRAVAMFEVSGTPVCSVCRVDDAHPARMYRVENEMMVPLMPELAAVRRQELPALFHRNGALYVFGPEQLRIGKIICDQMLPYEMAPEQSVNVDSELDIAVLEALLGLRR